MPETLTLPDPLPTTPVADPAAVVQGENFRITVLADGLLRLEYAPDGVFEDRASTFALHRRLPVPDFRVTEKDNLLEIVTDRMRLTYDRGPFTTSGLSVQILGNVSNYHSVWRFGEPAGNLGGTARTLDMANGRIPLEDGVNSVQGFALLDDSRSPLFTPDGWVAPRAAGRTDLYLFGYGLDFAESVRALYAVSGPVPVLPRFTLGNWWSRYHPYRAAEYRDLLERFAAAGLPFSVSVLDMDWHLVDVPAEYGSGWTGYTWNRELIEDPEAFLAWLHERGLRITLNVHPADGVRAFEDAYPAMARALGIDPESGQPIAFDVTDAEFLAVYLDVLHRGLERQGVDFWWLDWQSGPYSRVVGLDPLWMLNHFHFLDSARRGQDPGSGAAPAVPQRRLTFSRYAGPGSHRYPIGFSGDAMITWASLDFQPEFTATASNIGYGWWSHDIGGHMYGTRDEELTARWVQLGAFSPILRLHSGSNRFITKEPWSFGAEAAAVMTRYLRLRHRLVPYLHTMNHRAAREHAPLVQPVYWSHPRRREAFATPNEFHFGSQLLVAPITTPSDPVTRLGAVTCWLPPGVWTDVLSGRRYSGDRTVTVHRDLADIPVFAPAGAIVPLDAAEIPGNDPVNPAALELLVVPGSDGSFELVEDDGTGDGLDESGLVRTPIRYEAASGRVRIGPATGALGAVPARRSWTVTVAGTAASATATDVPVEEPVELALPTAPDRDLEADLFRLLERAYLEHELKADAYAAVTAPVPVARRLSELQALALPESLVSALSELLTAE